MVAQASIMATQDDERNMGIKGSVAGFTVAVGNKTPAVLHKKPMTLLLNTHLETASHLQHCLQMEPLRLVLNQKQATSVQAMQSSLA